MVCLTIMFFGLSLKWSYNYKNAAKFEKEVIKKIGQSAENRLIIAGLPIFAYTEIMLVSDPFIEQAINKIYGKEKEIKLVAPVVTGRLPQEHILRKTKSDNFRMRFDPEIYNYFVLEETPKNFCNALPLTTNKWGNISAVSLSCSKRAMLIYCNSTGEMRTDYILPVK